MYKIDVIIIGEMATEIDKSDTEMCCRLFKEAIEKLIRETNVVPIVGDWINPMEYEDENYSFDIGRIAGRNFDPNTETITFEIA